MNEVFLVMYDDNTESYFVLKGEWVGQHYFKCTEMTAEEINEYGYSLVTVCKTYEEAQQIADEAKEQSEFYKAMENSD